jgi:acyl carrier protein
MERNEVTVKLEKTFRIFFENDLLKLSDDMTTNDIDGWDSLAHMELLREIETVFPIKFKLEDLSKMKNVGCMVDIIMTKLYTEKSI